MGSCVPLGGGAGGERSSQRSTEKERDAGGDIHLEEEEGEPRMQEAIGFPLSHRTFYVLSLSGWGSWTHCVHVEEK